MAEELTHSLSFRRPFEALRHSSVNFGKNDIVKKGSQEALAARFQVLSKGFELIAFNPEKLERAALDGRVKLVGDSGILSSWESPIAWHPPCVWFAAEKEDDEIDDFLG